MTARLASALGIPVVFVTEFSTAVQEMAAVEGEFKSQDANLLGTIVAHASSIPAEVTGLEAKLEERGFKSLCMLPSNDFSDHMTVTEICESLGATLHFGKHVASRAVVDGYKVATTQVSDFFGKVQEAGDGQLVIVHADRSVVQVFAFVSGARF